MTPQHLIHFRVTGIVQGVSFRYYTQKEASKLHLRGWVKNNSDDSVEGAAAGPSDAISNFRIFLQKGPSSARVDKVDLIKEDKDASEELIKEMIGSSKSFEVR